MPRSTSPTLILGLLCVAGAASAAAPASAASAQAGDTTGRADTLAVAVDSAGKYATTLDSLSRRTAAVRAAIMRLGALHGARAERVESGLRLQLPFPGAERARPVPDSQLAPLLGAAELARRHYPGTSVAVLGTAGGGPPCGTAPERRRARAVVDLLRGAGGLEPERLRRGDCSRESEADPVQLTAAPAPDGPGVTVYIEWDAGDGPP